MLCDISDLMAVREALKEAEIEYDSVEQVYRSNLEVPADAELARKVANLIDALDDVDDVQEIYTNMSVSDEVAAELAED